ncbi:MAG: MATE family efflux transporter [Ancrocorticia sp.]|jgi:putative MATE family efflux protein|nr:MATE family efflux transporter [Ancrocorticia sp.]MCI2002371.1 MATE family efflux transporter [Ancrocorticia sp.]MCI2012201.1 MATE family efflux transporter [Ancrocorticia sp.]MCI2028834.1 MATE family efflux transporter [Ancrocorticia sp.]MCI2177690.1 MATE family efflux transporter [Ancrocorticia sp.]
MSTSLTSGTPWRVIIYFTIPLLIGNVVQQLYQVVDAMVVGQHLGVNALAAVGTTGGMLFLLMGFAWGLTSGFAIPTAQAFGAQDDAGVRSSVVAGSLLTAIGSVIVTVGGVLFSRDFLRLLQTPAELMDEATIFAVVSFAGATATMYFNYLSAIIRAIGDSRTPLLFLVVSCLINMGLVVVMIRDLGLGVAGAAAATVVSQALSVMMCLLYVMKYIPVLHVGRADLRAGIRDMGRHLQIGFPMGFQMSIIAIGALAVQVRLNTLGSQAVAAYTTATRVDGLATAFLQSIGLAVATFVAQNYGAGEYQRILIGVRHSLGIAIATALVLAVALISAGNPIVRLFVGSGNDDVVAMSHQYLIANGGLYFVLGILFVTRSALQGLGQTLVPTVAGVLELTMRVGVAIVLGGVYGFTGVVWANPAAWFGSVAILIPSWIVSRRALRTHNRTVNEVHADVALLGAY